MDAAQALADLTEISSQIESAVMAGKSGKVLAATFDDDARSERVAKAAGRLLEESSGAGREGLVQLEAATEDGSVFVVRDEERFVAAVTGPEPTVGLVFYDLKTCLRQVAEEKAAKSTPSKPKTKAAEPAEKETPAKSKSTGKSTTKRTTRKTAAEKKDEAASGSAEKKDEAASGSAEKEEEAESGS